MSGSAGAVAKCSSIALWMTVIFSPSAEIVHLRGRSGRQSPGPTRDAWRASHLAFYRKHLPRWAGLLEWYLSRTV